MASNDPSFTSTAEHRSWLASQAALPAGFRVGAHKLDFTPEESGKPARCTLTVIALERPTTAFGAVFTRNAFPGAPIIVGRQRLAEAQLSGVVINNKISNVCAPEGVARAEQVCAAAAAALGTTAQSILPSSTGIIGWRLPAAELCAALPQAVATLQGESILPAAEGIVTTDLYPKIRRWDFPGGGSIVGIAKGAGMVEPNLATMLVYLLTDVSIKRDALRRSLSQAVGDSFNAISVDSDQSTSDTVVAISSGCAPAVDGEAFDQALAQVCAELAEDVVRNGEGVRHVQRVTVSSAPTSSVARGVGKAVINSPLWKTALAGNDPNIGRLVMAVGKYLGNEHPEYDAGAVRIAFGDGDDDIFANGQFVIDREREQRLSTLFHKAELYPATPAADGITFQPPVDYPPHPRVVPIRIDLGLGSSTFTVIGNDLTHEYITENADYRS